MSFRFGEFDTAVVEGVTATLKAWPSLTLSPETVDLLDGVLYARTGYGSLTFEFDVLLSARTPAEVHALRDQLVAACAPTGALLALIPETGEGWRWWAACSALPAWQRGLWIGGVECQLRGTVAFLIPGGVGWAVPDEVFTGASSVAVVRSKGNLASYPTITMVGPFSGVTVTAGEFTLGVDVRVLAGQRLVLDYNTMDFGVWAGGVKVAHAAPGMSRFDRLSLRPSASTVVSAVAGSGAVSSLTVAANSRRG